MTLSVVMVSLVSVYAQTSNYAPHICDFFFLNMSAVSQSQNKKRKVIWEKLGLRRVVNSGPYSTNIYQLSTSRYGLLCHLLLNIPWL